MPQPSSPHIICEQHGHIATITLHRPQALNALTLDMVQAIAAQLNAWRGQPDITAIVIRGSSHSGPFGHFCAGGDIRRLHQAASAPNASDMAYLNDFFTHEYRLDYHIHRWGQAQPIIAIIDGIVMGGGMGLAQGAALRIATPRTQMAMPETRIGIFPDVGAGHFLGRCPGHAGEWLGLSGQSIGAAQAIEWGLADLCIPHENLNALWATLTSGPLSQSRDPAAVMAHLRSQAIPLPQLVQAAQTQTQNTTATEPSHHHAPPANVAAYHSPAIARVRDRIFALPDASAIHTALQAQIEALTTPAPTHDDTHSAHNPAPILSWATHTLHTLRQRSPLMQHITLAHIRRARSLPLAEVFRAERSLMQHCATSREALEGIRAQVIDKDQRPHWQPASVQDITLQHIAPYFTSPWPPGQHPLADLQD